MAGRTVFQNGECKNQAQINRGTELKDASCGGLAEGLIDNDFAPWFLFKSITKKPTNQNVFLMLKKRNMNSTMDYFCFSDISNWTFHQVILALLFVILLKILLTSLSGTCSY